MNATPDAVRAPSSLKLIAAGKAVFCEKPLAVNGAEAFSMAKLPRKWA